MKVSMWIYTERYKVEKQNEKGTKRINRVSLSTMIDNVLADPMPRQLNHELDMGLSQGMAMVIDIWHPHAH